MGERKTGFGQKLKNLFSGGKNQYPTDQIFTGMREQKPDINGNYPIICPYCLENVDPNDVLIRASYIGTTDNGFTDFFPQNDEKYAAFWQRMEQEQDSVLPILIHPTDTTKVAQRIPADFKKTVYEVVDIYGNSSNEKVCPHCHNPLPLHTGAVPNYIISLLGNTFVGKTAYLTKMVYLISQCEMLRDLGISCHAENHKAKEILQKHGEIFKTVGPDENGQKMTRATAINFQEPAIYTLRYREDGINHDIGITFYDFPGEAIWRDDMEFIKLKTRNVKNANGWMLLLDCSSLNKVYDVITQRGDQEKYISASGFENGRSGSQISSPPSASQVLDAICSHWVDENGVIDIPVSVVITKSDLMEEFRDELELTGERQFLIDNTSETHRRYVDCDDLLKMHVSIQSTLDEWKENIVTLCRNNLNTYMWFAMSSTGQPVEYGENINAGRPIRALEPLEWLLLQFGFLKGHRKYAKLEELKIK